MVNGKSNRVVSLIPGQVKWDTVGIKIEGFLVNKELVSFKDQTRGRYVVKTDQGMKLFMGTFVIDQIMPMVELGTEFGIEYLGEEGTTSNNKMKRFDIYLLNVDGESGKLEEVGAVLKS